VIEKCKQFPDGRFQFDDRPRLVRYNEGEFINKSLRGNFSRHKVLFFHKQNSVVKDEYAFYSA
jgi:hypothetical protein